MFLTKWFWKWLNFDKVIKSDFWCCDHTFDEVMDFDFRCYVIRRSDLLVQLDINKIQPCGTHVLKTNQIFWQFWPYKSNPEMNLSNAIGWVESTKQIFWTPFWFANLNPQDLYKLGLFIALKMCWNLWDTLEWETLGCSTFFISINVLFDSDYVRQ
jgi:hypothetical protein